MKAKRHIYFSFSIVILFIMAIGVTGCQNNRLVVPEEIDTDEIFKALQPNEEDSPENMTFGVSSIPGFIFDYDITTRNPDVFVYYQNFTVLDINPAIIQDLFSFTQKQLGEYGFINDSISFKGNEISDYMREGLSYKEAAARLLDTQKEAFEARLSVNDSLIYPQNIYFQIYPVYLDDKYVTYRESAYCYTGGAHGMSITYLRTYELSSGKFMTLNDIVKPERQDEVREEVAAHMAYSYPIYENITTVDQYIDSLNVWLGNFNGDEVSERITLKNYPLPDPAITKDGLVFVYQMYALTPGSDGCPVVFIPYKDLKGCLMVLTPQH